MNKILIKRYRFGATERIRLGSPFRFEIEARPAKGVTADVRFFFCNSPWPGFVLIEEITTGGVPLDDTYGAATDSFVWRSTLPVSEAWLCEPAVRVEGEVKIRGSYTGFVPEGFTKGEEYLFHFHFSGPAEAVSDEGVESGVGHFEVGEKAKG